MSSSCVSRVSGTWRRVAPVRWHASCQGTKLLWCSATDTITCPCPPKSVEERQLKESSQQTIAGTAHLIAWPQMQVPPAVRNQVDALCGVAGKYNIAPALRVYQARYLLPRFLIRRSRLRLSCSAQKYCSQRPATQLQAPAPAAAAAARLGGQVVHAAVHVGVVAPIVVVQRMQHHLRLLRCGTVVQVHQRPAVHRLLQYREVSAQRCAERGWAGCPLCRWALHGLPASKHATVRHALFIYVCGQAVHSHQHWTSTPTDQSTALLLVAYAPPHMLSVPPLSWPFASLLNLKFCSAADIALAEVLQAEDMQASTTARPLRLCASLPLTADTSTIFLHKHLPQVSSSQAAYVQVLAELRSGPCPDSAQTARLHVTDADINRPIGFVLFFPSLCPTALLLMHCAEAPGRPTAVRSCIYTFQSSSAVARTFVHKQRRRCTTAALQQHDFTGTRGELFVDYRWGSRSVVVLIAALPYACRLRPPQHDTQALAGMRAAASQAALPGLWRARQ